MTGYFGVQKESVKQVQISSGWNAGEDLIELIQMALKFLKSQSVV